MKNFGIRIFCLSALMACGPAARAAVDSASALTLDLKAENGKTRFIAIGNPSALRINGEGAGPEGKFQWSQKGDQLEIGGQLQMDLSTLSTGMDLRDDHMKNKYLDVQSNKTAILLIEDFRTSLASLSGGVSAPFRGKLNFHGVLQDTQGEAKVKREGKDLLVVASFRVKLPQHGVTVPSFAGITVADEVDVQVEFKVPEPAAKK